MEKRGMFFTVMAIFIITLFFMSYTIYDLVKDRSSVNKRVETLNNFVFSVEQDVPRYLYIAGFRSIFLIHEEIVSSGNYIDSVENSFDELFYNGSLNGEEEDLMSGATFDDMVDSFGQFANKVNANISFGAPSVLIDQQDPWNIRISLNLTMEVCDQGGLVSWNKSMTVDSFVPIEGFEDAMYLVETGQVTNTISRSPYTVFVVGGDVSNLEEHVENSYYVASSSAPSFLDRLEGRNAANVNGIESFVYLPSLTARGISTSDKSCVDYIYFSDDNPAHFSVAGMPSWFGIDDEDGHLAKYGI
ncbi:MAG: hypothetical protein V1889_01370 [archaeon]